MNNPSILNINKQADKKRGLSTLERSKSIPESEEFKQWFGQEGLRDELGEPILLFHGSGIKFAKHNLSKFKETHSSGAQVDGGYFGSGSYFTREHKLAEVYANKGAKKHVPDACYITHSYCKSNNFITFSTTIPNMVDENGAIDDSKIPKPIRDEVQNVYKEKQKIHKKSKQTNNGWGSLEPTDENISIKLLTESITEVSTNLGYDGARGINPISKLEEFVIFNEDSILTVGREYFKITKSK